MVLAGGDDKIIGLRLLQDEPHALDIVLGIAPVAQGVEIAQIELVLETLGDTCGSEGDLASNEGLATTLGFVVEEDTVAAVHIVALTVVLHDPEAIHLGYAVRRTGIEGCGLLLRHFLDESEELGSGSLIDAAFVGKTCDTHSLKESQNAHGISLSCELGHVEGHLHMALGGEVIDLVGLDLGDDTDER